MRGSPPFHLILFALLFALLVVPLVRLTQSRESRENVHGAGLSAPAESAKVPALLRIRRAHRPSDFSLKLDGQELVPDKVRRQLPEEFEFEHLVPNPKEGFELVLKAEWPAGTGSTAISVEIEPEQYEALSKTKWTTDGQIAGALLFRW